MTRARFTWLAALGAMLLAGTAARAADVAGQFEAARAALRPASESAAQQAVVAYFAAQGAAGVPSGYAFNPVVNGIVRAESLSEAGWFMCGNTSGAAAPGKAGRILPFIAFFDPSKPDVIRDGSIESGNFELVSAWCRQLYGMIYLPLSQ